jgi:hypothetical protein
VIEEGIVDLDNSHCLLCRPLVNSELCPLLKSKDSHWISTEYNVFHMHSDDLRAETKK